MPTLRHSVAALGAVATIVAAGALAVVTTGTPAAAAPATVHPKIPQPDCCTHPALRPGQELRSTDSPAVRTLDAATLPPGPGSAHGETQTGVSLSLTNGTLVESGPNGSDWQVGGGKATRLVFQTDHNVVLRDAAGRALWSTGTAGTAAAYFGPYGNGQIVTQDAAGQVVSAVGPSFTSLPGVVIGAAASPGRMFSLVVQPDGNLVEYDVRDRDHPRAVWSTGTSGSGAVRVIAQQDGNLVVRRLGDGRAVWASGSHGPVAYYQLDVQDDGNVVLRRTDGAHRLNVVWASYTRDRKSVV